MKGKENTINRKVAHFIDILPTCLELAESNYPDSIHGQKTLRIDGKSLMPLIMTKTKSIHDTLYWEHEGGRAIRVGEWKMSALGGKTWELFHVSKDHTETQNLAEKFPYKVSEMNKLWQKWADSLKIQNR